VADSIRVMLLSRHAGGAGPSALHKVSASASRCGAIPVGRRQHAQAPVKQLGRGGRPAAALPPGDRVAGHHALFGGCAGDGGGYRRLDAGDIEHRRAAGGQAIAMPRQKLQQGIDRLAQDDQIEVHEQLARIPGPFIDDTG
jgi:hypothetical protein